MRFKGANRGVRGVRPPPKAKRRAGREMNWKWLLLLSAILCGFCGKDGKFESGVLLCAWSLDDAAGKSLCYSFATAVCVKLLVDLADAGDDAITREEYLLSDG